MKNQRLIFGVDFDAELLKAGNLVDGPLKRVLVKVLNEMKFAGSIYFYDESKKLSGHIETDKLANELISLSVREELPESELSDFMIRYNILAKKVEKELSISLTQERYNFRIKRPIRSLKMTKKI